MISSSAPFAHSSQAPDSLGTRSCEPPFCGVRPWSRGEKELAAEPGIEGFRRSSASRPARDPLVELVGELDLCERAIRRSERLRRVRELIDERGAPSVTLQEAAEAAAMEYSSMSKSFHKTVGVPFTHWRTLLRVVAAARLLVDTDLPVAVIAQRVGFARGSSLRSAFQRLVGSSPREYRKRWREAAGPLD